MMTIDRNNNLNSRKLLETNILIAIDGYESKSVIF